MTGPWTADRSDEFKRAYLNFERHVYIDSKEKGRICLAEHVYEGQKRLLDGICGGLVNGVHDNKCLKSRQLGISTRARSIGMFWLGMFDGLKGAMIFDTGPNKDNAHAELYQMIENLPSKVDFPRIKRNNRDMMILSNDSTVQFRNAGTRSSRGSKSLGTSLGVNLLIASEMLNWHDQEGVISLQQALAKTYDNRLFLWESTARGYEGVWHDLWTEAVEDPISQNAIFVGWWSHPLQSFERWTPQFERYGQDSPSAREQARIDAVKELYGWQVTPEQVAWYRWYMDPSRKADDDQDKIEDTRRVQEQPWTAEEAFQLTGSSFFESTKLAGHMEVASREKPTSVWKFFPGTDFLSTEFYPARVRRDIQLTVWEDPQPGAAYVVAGDVAFGHDEKNDRSVAEVLRCYADGVDQVAEFASASTPTHQFAWLIMAICGWYGQGGQGMVSEIVEINGPGEAVLREMDNVKKSVQNGYLNMPAKERGLQNIFNNVREFVYKRSDSHTAGSARAWKTSGQVKEAIMERLRDEVHRGTFSIRSPALLEEMRTIVRDGSSIGASGSAKDDRVYTCAMGIRAWEDQLLRTLSVKRMTREADRARTQLSPEARYRLFTQYQIDTMFNGNARKRGVQRQQQAKALWRFR